MEKERKEGLVVITVTDNDKEIKEERKSKRKKE